MKRFTVLVLAVSVFFIGLGSIFEETKAKFNSDEKALELIGKARAAIGGNNALVDVNSLSINGVVTHYYQKNNLTESKQGTIEINMQFPDKMSKMIKIGDPGDSAAGGDMEIIKDVDVVVVGDDVNVTSTGEDEPVKKRVRIKKMPGGGTEDVTVGGGEGDEKQEVIIKRRGEGEGGTWTSDDGQKVVISKDVEGGGMHHNGGGEMLRLTTALLMRSPGGTDANYKFIGTGNVDGFATNNIEVISGGSSFKVFLDSSTNLPRMISFEGMDNLRVIKMDKGSGGESAKAGSGANVFVMKSPGDSKTVEHQIRFSDFRPVGGLMLPHRWDETVAGKQNKSINITSFEINPANIDEKFSNKKVFVRKMKGEN